MEPVAEVQQEEPRVAAEELDPGNLAFRAAVATAFPSFGLAVETTVVPVGRLSLEGGASTLLLYNTVWGRVGARLPLAAGPRHAITLTPAAGYRGVFIDGLYEDDRVGGPTATAGLDWYVGNDRVQFDLRVTLGAFALLADGSDSYPRLLWPEAALSYGVAF